MAGCESTCVARETYKVILRAGSLEAAHSSFRIFRNSNNGRVLFSRKLHLADVLTRALRAQRFIQPGVHRGHKEFGWWNVPAVIQN